MVDLTQLEKMLQSGQDNALLRFSLGGACLKQKKQQQAVEHLARAVELDPEYTAAWKLYGRALHQAGRAEQAVQAYQTGIGVAQRNGDKQAEKEMTVFLKRLQPE